MPAPGSAARCLRRSAALLICAAALASPLGAALEGYYRFAGIGSSADAQFANWRPILSLSTAVERRAGALRPTVQNIFLQKVTDSQSPPLMQRVFSGQKSASAVIYLRNSGESFPVFILNLKDADVRDYQVSADTLTGNGLLYENLSVAFASLEVSVTKSDPGQGLVTSTAAWNVSTNAVVTSAAPTLTLGAATLTTNEDTPAAMSYTHADDYSDLETLTRIASSSDPALVAASGLVFSGTGAGRLLTVTPVANASGTATITVTLRDTAGLTTSSSFALTVNAVNDAPVVAPVATQTTTVGTPHAVTVSLSDVDTTTPLTLSATSDNATVLPAGGIAFSGTGASRTLTLTPAAAGSAIVTLTANDGAANSAPVTFTFIANPVGFGIPTDITLSAATVAENSPAGRVVGPLGVVDADNASGHTFTLVDDAGSRFALNGNALVVANGALLDFESAASHAITVRVTDPDQNSFSKQLTVAVTNVNETPAVALGSLGAAAPGRALTLTALAFSDPDAGSAEVRVEFSVLHGVLASDTTGILAGKVAGNGSATLTVTAPLADLNAALAAGALTYTPAASFLGDDILQVVCSDLGHTGSGGALSDTRLAAIPVAIDSFASWQAANFTADELADPAISGALANPAGDGLTNLLKYALGLDPHAPSAVRPEFGQTSGEWTFTFSRPASRPDVTYTVQSSPDLTTWTDVTAPLVLVATDPTTGHQTWRATVTKGSGNTVFVRLQVSLTGP
jgi:type VI protein secretion system component Hcp